MPALAAPVTTYINSIVASLTTGSDLGSNLRGAAKNFLRAQDMATVLDLLDDAITQTANIVVVSGTTTTITIAGLQANLYTGATVTFADDTLTTALRGLTRTVKSNTGTVITLTEALPEAPAEADEFTMTGSVLSPYVAILRDNKNRGDAPLANMYGNSRTLADVFEKMKTISGTAGVFPIVSRPGALTAAGSTTTAVKVREELKIDSMQKMELVIAGQTRTIVSNDDFTLYLNAPITAPASGVAYTIQRNTNQVNQNRKHTVHPGGHPDNRTLAYSITLLVTQITAIALPA